MAGIFCSSESARIIIKHFFGKVNYPEQNSLFSLAALGFRWAIADIIPLAAIRSHWQPLAASQLSMLD
jgi:hypothetical protein